MTIQLTKGERFNLVKEAPDVKEIEVGLGWKASDRSQEYDLDVSVFMLGADGKIPDEKYFVFYNNSESMDGSVKHSGDNKNADKDGNNQKFSIDLTKVSPDIEEMLFVVTIHEAKARNQRFSQVENAFIKLSDRSTNEEVVRYDLKESFDRETAVEFGRFYKRNGEWRFQAVGTGYNAGLQTFVDKYYVEKDGERSKVEPPPPATPAPTPPPETSAKSRIDLLKKKVDLSLEKKNLTTVKARVGIAVDISGSMDIVYKNGTLQKVLERLLAVAIRLDDNGKLDVWVFNEICQRLPAVTEENYEDYANREILPTFGKVGNGRYDNYAPFAIDVMQKYLQEEPAKFPNLIVVIGDGGCTDSDRAELALKAASKYPIFWQFIGVPVPSQGSSVSEINSNFEWLKYLDRMEGRVADNANFFEVSDIDAISDEELYDRLLNEFPLWLKDAIIKGIF
ncbi:MAG: TerD family protein [Cyanobacteriota bacterium]|nr:TerD family protein [Cyanobacteriota bacterium]